MRSRIAFHTAAVLLTAAAAFAQPAPAPAPDPKEPPPRQEGSVDLAFVSTTGNSDTQSLGLGGTYIYRPDLWELKWKAGFIRNETDDEVSAEAFTFLFRADRTLSDRLSAFGSYDYLRDRFAGLENRHTLAGGLSYLLIDAAPHRLQVDGGLGYTNEERLDGDDISTMIGLVGLAYDLKISETAEFSDDMRFDFSLSDGEDWRWQNVAAISAKLTTLFSLKLSNTIRYMNSPPRGFDTTDTITAVALVAKF